MRQKASQNSSPSRVQRAALIGLVANVFLALIKLGAGILGGSYALIADAAESITDIVSSVVIWGGLHMASRPPDANHPYGHGKIESLAALVVTMFIAAAGVGIGVQAIGGLFVQHVAPAPFTLAVLICVVIAKEALARFMRSAAKEEQSAAGFVESWHHRSDAITSLAAAIGISAALIGGPSWASADTWAALFTACIIVLNACLLARLPIQELTDAEPTDVTERASELAMGVAGVRRVETVHSRRYGRELFVDMHIEVDPELSVREAHRLAHEAQDAIRAGLPRVRRVLIHVEPFEGAARPDR